MLVTPMLLGLILNFFAASLNVPSQTTDRVAARKGAQCTNYG